MPSSKEWLAVFSAALLETTYVYNYTQVNPSDLTPEAAAALAYQIYTDWLAAECSGGECPPVELPGGSRIWRRNTNTGKYEYVDEELGTWEFPDGSPVATLPAPEPRAEPTDEEKKCLAAANAVNTLKHLWDSLLSLWNDEVEPTAAQAAFAVDVGLTLGGAYYPPLLAVAELLGAGFSLFFEAFALITSGTWDDAFLDGTKCIFFQHATLNEDDTVSFDHNAIIWNMNLRTWVNPQNMLITMQLHYVMGMLGEEGVNRAGGTTAITESDCTCGVWSRTWEHGEMWEGVEWEKSFGIVDVSHDIQPQGSWPGQWAAATCTITIPVGTVIREVGIRAFYPSGAGYFQAFLNEGSTFWLHSGNPDDVPYSSNWAFYAGYYSTDSFHNFTVERWGSGEETTLTFALRGQHNNGVLIGFRLRGEGPCPFTTGRAD